MRITRQTDYATRTMFYLTRLGPHQRASTKSIAKAQKIPLAFLPKIISRLVVAGLLNTSRGSRGGVSLARHPSNISVLDVIEAIDGPIVLHDCDADPEDCEFSEDCPLNPFWCDTQALLVDRLQNATFDQFGPERNSSEF